MDSLFLFTASEHSHFRSHEAFVVVKLKDFIVLTYRNREQWNSSGRVRNKSWLLSVFLEWISISKYRKYLLRVTLYLVTFDSCYFSVLAIDLNSQLTSCLNNCAAATEFQT